MTETELGLRAIECRIKTYSKNFMKYQFIDYLNDQYPNKEATMIWKAQNDILEHHMSQLRDYKENLAEQVDKINLNILSSQDISDTIEIIKIGLATYRQI